jgi:hypothetical protein
MTRDAHIWLTPAQAAAVLHVHPETLRARADELPEGCVRRTEGGHRRYRADLLRPLELAVQAAPPAPRTPQLHGRDLFSFVKETVPLTKYLTDQGVELRDDEGGRLSCRCPFHEEQSASMFIYPEDRGYRSFHCFGCNASGSIIDAVMYWDGYDSPIDALEYLDRRYGLGLRWKPMPARAT